MSSSKRPSASREAPPRSSARLNPPAGKAKEAEIDSSGPDKEEEVDQIETDTERDVAPSRTTIGPDLNVAALLRELELARAELAQLRAQQQPPTRVSDQPLPTTETPPVTLPPPRVVPYPSENPYSPPLSYYGKPLRSEKTPKIEELQDGSEPTFKQWQASIQDRLEINSDHYRTERERMALVWGHTSGLAKEYLEPRYLSNDNAERFQNAEEMIALLKSYFITGNEVAKSRFQFDRLQMTKDETFPAFKAQFLSAAVRGEVPRSE